MTAMDPVSNHHWRKPFIHRLTPRCSARENRAHDRAGNHHAGVGFDDAFVHSGGYRTSAHAIQLFNGVVYPLQSILLIPFCRLGAWIFRADASTISLGGVTAAFVGS
jgi:hypothetical protein